MKPVRRAALIVNTRSRKGATLFADARRALKALGIICDAHPVRNPEALGDAVTRALARNPDALVLGGGDGTVSSVVDHLVGRDVPLALLPLGTANSFARTLGIPIDLDEAVNLIAAGTRRRVDLGLIGNDHFANCAAMGLAPLIATTIPAVLKRWGGRVGYAIWAMLQLLRFRPFQVRVGDGPLCRTLSAVEVRIANGSFQGGTELIENAEVDSGQIIVQVVEGSSRFALVSSWLSSLFGFNGQSRLREFHGTSFRIETDPPQPVSIDGEVVASTPLTAGIAPRAIELFVPPVWFDRAPREISRAG